ncbi:MAG: 30S ribosomal protein S12 methylthiotransferase RimO [Lentisphaeria bacterium]|nr:30S ribosomal protein S12 methylthiotransferase RimO [Lentisphaeria bacterium]
MADRQRKVMVVSLGCAKNLVDTEVMCGSLAVGGYMLTNVPEEADVVLINTCGFIADARAEAEQEIRDALEWRLEKKSRRLAVAGCLPQRDLQGTREAFPGVDLFLGLDDVPRAAALFDTLFSGGKNADTASAFDSPAYIYDSAAPRLQLTPANYAYVKIAEGCDHRCAFCAIPGIRGRQRSRPIDDIVAECRQLLAGGALELNLIAQDTTRYGRDLADGTTLAKLLRACEERLDGDFWIRVLYTHPRYFDDDLIAAYQACPRLVPYVDIPLQHISDTVLQAMGRGCSEEETRTLMERLRTDIPGVIIRTTFLVGFPGETAADFDRLRDYVQTFEFDRLGVFAFSPEAGTPAARITEGLVPAETAAARRDALMEIQRSISRRRNEALVGQRVTVLVEGMDADGNHIGRTAADAPEVDNLVAFTAPDGWRADGFARVSVSAASDYDLTGRLV